MECLRCMEMISEYLDRELSTSEYQDMRAHLDECMDCRNTMNELTLLREATKMSIESISVPLDLTDKIIMSILAEKHRTAKNQRVTSILLILLSSPLLIVLTRTFSSIFYLIYATGTVFWRSSMTLLTVESPWLMLSLGILSVIGISMGAFVIKNLISDFEFNEVFQ